MQHPDKDIGCLMAEFLAEASYFFDEELRGAPKSFEKAINVCSNRTLPETMEWFKKELTLIANNNNIRFGNQLIEQGIVIAAVKQLSPEIEEYNKLWHQIIKHPRYSSIAIHALTKDDPIKLIALLGEWWETNPFHKQGELTTFLKQAHSVKPLTENMDYLKHEARRWTIELRMAVNTSLEECGLPKAFPPQLD